MTYQEDAVRYEKLRHRCIENLRSYVVVSRLMSHERKCRLPKSVKMFAIDGDEDLWGMSYKCLYRFHEGQCYRYIFDHDAFMSLHILTRNILPVEEVK